MPPKVAAAAADADYDTAVAAADEDAGAAEEDAAALAEWNAGAAAEGVQLVGMSATLPNVRDVARWLGAALLVARHRPVPLERLLLVGDELRNAAGRRVRAAPPPPPAASALPNLAAREREALGALGALGLVAETVAAGRSALIFCKSRRAAEGAAKFLALALGGAAARVGGAPGAAARAAAAARLRALGRPPNAALAAALEAGAAWHHAGLEPDEREAVEAAHRAGGTAVLCCTSTMAAGALALGLGVCVGRMFLLRVFPPVLSLSSSHPLPPARPTGVNLPARLVLITSPYDPAGWNRPLSPAALRQMMGRAGRAGLDAAGLAVVVAPSAAAAARLGPLLAAPPEPVSSALHGGARGMARAMLEVVSAGAVASPADVQRFIRCTLLAATRAEAAVTRATKEALRWLCAAEQGMVAWSDAGGA